MTQQDAPEAPGTAVDPPDRPGVAAHVLLVVENIPAAVDQRLRKQVPALLAAGHHVTVVTRRDPAQDPWRGVPGLTLLEHPAPPESPGVLGYLQEYGLAFGWAAVLAPRAHRRRPVDVVQFCQPPDVYFPIAWLLRALGARVVVDQRDLMPELFAARYGTSPAMERVLRWLERRTQAVATVTITVNHHLRRRLETAGAPAERIAVVRNGPRLALVEAARPDPALRSGAAALCCWAGKMGRQDRVDLLVDAIAVLVHDHRRRDVRFVLLGDGECLDELRAQVVARGLEAWVALPGWLSEDELFTHLATADVGLDTSLQVEVSPVKVMEYMAFGLPVVAFDLPETTALTAGAGVAVPAGDVRRFAAELDALLDDPARARRLGAEGRRRVVDELCWERQAAVYLEAIDRAAAPTRRRRRRAPDRGVRTRRERA
ncbi:glycosyltransferase family 4 protein [Actinomycetospora lutea]|uniref:glycosyltransferase family 4 protein n=1 Tax=Actinomycetospora lutea TaxID=663604 RepID=UPI00236712D0|nr:glycosyltransferase family 4 protein [Actinomycetospora lutea]MDD7941996.1 glycosyltransferase family 4 protein [Actinomycetospora lutea]